jgi:hypothetical protein
MRCLLIVLLGLLVSSLGWAESKSGCAVWAGYTAKALLGSTNGMMGVPNVFYVPKEEMGPGVHAVPYITEEVKASFKSDEKALMAKYQEFVLAYHVSQAEILKEFEKAGSGGAPTVGGTANPRVIELQKKAAAAAESFKKDLLNHGTKFGCSLEMDSAIAQEQLKTSQAIFKINQEMIAIKERQNRSLAKENRG